MMKKLCILIILIGLFGILPSLLQYGCFMVAKDFSTQQFLLLSRQKECLLRDYLSGHGIHILEVIL